MKPGKTLLLVVALAVVVALPSACGTTAIGPGGEQADDVTQMQEAGAVASLIAALESEDASTRADAAEALGSLGDVEAVPALIAALDDVDSSVVANAVDALARLGDARAVEPLADLLDQPAATFDDESVKDRIAQVLGELGDARAVPALVRSSTETYDYSSEIDAYETAKEALIAIDEPAVEPLIDALSLKSAMGRQVAAEALGAIGDPRAVEPLIAYAGRGYEAAGVASTALAAIGKPAVKPLVAALEKAVAKEDGSAAEFASSTLAEIGGARSVSALTAAMRADVIPWIWNAASDALAHVYRKDVVKLLAMLESSDTVRIYWGLIGLGKESAVDELVAALDAYGGETMAEDYLNSGNAKLEQAGRQWATSRGYTITEIPGFGGAPWGSKA